MSVRARASFCAQSVRERGLFIYLLVHSFIHQPVYIFIDIYRERDMWMYRDIDRDIDFG